VKLFVTDAILARKGDTNDDSYVSLREAYVYAANNAPQITRGQRNGPQHPHLYGGDGGDQWFLKAPPPPPPPPPPEPEPSQGGGDQPRHLLPVCLIVCI